MSLYTFALIPFSAAMCGALVAVFQESFEHASRGRLTTRTRARVDELLQAAGWPLVLGIALCPAILASFLSVGWPWPHMADAQPARIVPLAFLLGTQALRFRPLAMLWAEAIGAVPRSRGRGTKSTK